MLSSLATAASLGGQTSGQITVISEPSTGKSSLILVIDTKSFPYSILHVLPPSRLTTDFIPDRVPITIIDTSLWPENRAKLIVEVQMAAAVVLTYTYDWPSTLDQLNSYLLPELQSLEVRVPVIVVGCKLDLREEQQGLELVMMLIMQQFREIETYMDNLLL